MRRIISQNKGLDHHSDTQSLFTCRMPTARRLEGVLAKTPGHGPRNADAATAIHSFTDHIHEMAKAGAPTLVPALDVVVLPPPQAHPTHQLPAPVDPTILAAATAPPPAQLSNRPTDNPASVTIRKDHSRQGNLPFPIAPRFPTARLRAPCLRTATPPCREEAIRVAIMCAGAQIACIISRPGKIGIGTEMGKAGLRARSGRVEGIEMSGSQARAWEGAGIPTTDWIARVWLLIYYAREYFGLFDWYTPWRKTFLKDRRSRVLR